jgi:hypothetical protein
MQLILCFLNYSGYFHMYLFSIVQDMGKIHIKTVSRDLNHISVLNCVIICGNIFFPP